MGNKWTKLTETVSKNLFRKEINELNNIKTGLVYWASGSVISLPFIFCMKGYIEFKKYDCSKDYIERSGRVPVLVPTKLFLIHVPLFAMSTIGASVLWPIGVSYYGSKINENKFYYSVFFSYLISEHKDDFVSRFLSERCNFYEYRKITTIIPKRLQSANEDIEDKNLRIKKLEQELSHARKQLNNYKTESDINMYSTNNG